MCPEFPRREPELAHSQDPLQRNREEQQGRDRKGRGSGKGTAAGDGATIPDDDICVDEQERTGLSSLLSAAWKEVMPLRRPLFTRQPTKAQALEAPSTSGSRMQGTPALAKLRVSRQQARGLRLGRDSEGHWAQRGRAGGRHTNHGDREVCTLNGKPRPHPCARC